MKTFYQHYILSLLRNFPWYLLLWPVFYAYNINGVFYGFIDHGTMWVQILKWEFFLIAFFFFFRFFFSNNIYSAIMIIWIGFLFFYAHPLRFLFLKFPPTHILSEFPYMISFWIFIGILMMIYFIKTKSKPVVLSRFLMYLFITMTFFEAINYTVRVSKNRYESFELKYRPTVSFNSDSIIDPATYPDIYHLVFDSYTNSSCMKRQFNYDNSILNTSLEKEGFFIADSSHSNYFDSPVSIASIFNMAFIPKADKAIGNELVFFCGLRNLDNNHLWNFLEKKNYTINNLSVFNIKNYTTPLNTIYPGSTDVDLLKQKTLENVSYPQLLSFFNKNLWQPELNFLNATKENILADTLIIETGLKKILNSTQTNPVFFYSHCMIPHAPYVLDSTGKVHPSITQNADNPARYLEECIYLRKTILRLVQEIKQKATGPFIIIVQGDHGYRHFKQDINEKECFNILNALYFSDQDYSKLYKSISSVNTYRCILNKYFKTNLTLLKDTSYYPN